MDPLSISASVITILQTTTAIISVCYNVRAALRNEPWSLTRIITELKAFRSILESLEELVQGLNQPQSSGRGRIFELISSSDNGPLVICQRELDILDKKLRVASHTETNLSKRKAVLQALRWQLRDKDAKACLERIERCKTTLSLALDGARGALLTNIQDSTVSVQATAQSIDHKVTVVRDHIRVEELDGEHKALMQWLSPVDPCENHDAATSAHQEGTNHWFFESSEFTEWYQAKTSFLWLSGFPGAGKTTIFSQVVAYLTQSSSGRSDGAGIAYFYCDFTRSELQCAKNVIGSLVAQLCSQFQHPEKLLLAYRDSLTPGKRRRPSWDVLKDTILWFSKERKILILSDALDECEKREEILEFFCKLSKEQGNISVFVTSREEADIEVTFQSYPRLRMENRRVEVDRDIQSCIDQRLATDANLKNLPLTVKTDIKLSLMEKCAGMFRWAQCQLDALSHLRTIKSIRMSLNQLPKSLNETYANILRKVRRDDVELLRRLLLWVAFTVLPLTIEELQDAVAVEAGIGTLNAIEESRLNDPKDILSIGGSLLSVSESGHVKLAHLSVKDYLLSADIKASPDLCGYGMAPEKANQELAINCITYLSLDSLANGPVEAQEDWQGRLARHLLLKHVAKGWTYFLRAASSTPELSGLVSNFFAAKSRQTFMSWIQILNSNWIFNWDDYPRHASPLYYAASFGLGDVVECLIRDGVDLDAPGSRFGGTALHGATLREHVSIMRTLLESGAQPSRADFNRITPLHTAVRIGNAEVIRTLLEFGASKDAADSLGETPHDWAIKAGQVSSQRLLRGEEYKVSDEPPRTKRSTVYERATAFFPAMAVAQGLSISSSMVRV